MKGYFGNDPEHKVEKLNSLPQTIAVDVETVSLEGAPILLAIAPNPNEAFFFTVKEEGWREILKSHRNVFFNAKFDLDKLGMDLDYEDAYLVYRILGEEECSLKALAWNKGMIEFPTARELMRKHRAKTMEEVPLEEVAKMCCQHAMATYFLWEEAQGKIPKLYSILDKPMIKVLADMEHRGVYIDMDELSRQLIMHKHIVEERKHQFTSAYGAINMNSPMQLKKVLGVPNTNKQTLAQLGSYAAQVLLEYRRANKAINTYLLPFSDVDDNGRLHCSFDYTRTGRLRSTDPDLQNLTRGELRRIIAAPRGFVLLDIDYDQLELRVLAHLANEKRMLAAFAKGEDLHAITGDALCRSDRYLGKTLNFAALYGASEYKIMELVGCTLEEGKEIKEKYNTLYPDYADFVKETRKFAREHFYVETALGRRRQIRELTSGSFAMREKGMREAVNTIIQGTAAGIVKLAMVELSNLPLVNQVHDELIFEMTPEEIETSKGRIEDVCESVYPLLCGLEVEIKIGENYENCH